MSEAKKNNYENFKTYYCTHCLWNNSVATTLYPKNYKGPRPEFLEEYKVFNIFSMFGKVRYTMNFVTIQHNFNYNLTELISIVNTYATTELPKKFNIELIPNYYISHNSQFTSDKGSKEHVHILLTILPGNGYRKLINEKYDLIHGMLKQDAANAIYNSIEGKRKDSLYLEKLKSISDVDPDNKQEYEDIILQHIADIYGFDRWQPNLKTILDKSKSKKLFDIFFRESPPLYGKGIYFTKKGKKIFDFNINNLGEYYVETFDKQNISRPIDCTADLVDKYILLFTKNIDTVNYFIKISSIEGGYKQQFMFEFVSDRLTYTDFEELNRKKRSQDVHWRKKTV
jgi:hypothetical protein